MNRPFRFWSVDPWLDLCNETVKDYYELHLHKTNIANRLNDFEIFEVTVLRNSAGLGFSITGGIDSPVSPSDIHIYISKIIPGGAANLSKL